MAIVQRGIEVESLSGHAEKVRDRTATLKRYRKLKGYSEMNQHYAELNLGHVGAIADPCT